MTPRRERTGGLPRERFSGGGLAPGGVYDGLVIEGADWTDGVGPNAHFLECTLVGVTLRACNLRRASLSGSEVRNAQVALADLAESQWTHVEVTGSVFAGADLSAAQLRWVTFRSCKLDAVNLRYAQLAHVRFEQCLLRDVDLAAARLTSVSFPGSQIRGLRLGAATLSQVDFRDAELDIRQGYGALRGAIIDGAQLIELAPGLAAELGLEVRWSRDAEPRGS